MKKQVLDKKTEQRQSTSSLGTSIYIILFGILAGIAIQHFFKDWIEQSFNPSRSSLAGLLVFAIVLVVIGAIIGYKTLFKLFRSYEFAIVILVALTLATVTGTLVLQKESHETYEKIYSNLVSEIFSIFFLKDLYHSLWFYNLLLLLVLSLVAVTANRLPITKRKAGFFMVHLGVIVALVGALIGNLLGIKGYIDIHEDETVDSINIIKKNLKSGYMMPLGFQVRMEKFELEKYDPQFKIYVYELEKSSGQYKIYDSLPVVGDPVKKVKGTPIRIIIKNLYPDFYQEELAEPKSDKPVNPVIKLGLTSNNNTPFFSGLLIANQPGKNYYINRKHRINVRFTWNPVTEKEYANWFSTTPHVIKVMNQDSKLVKELNVEMGKSYFVNEYNKSIEIMNFYADFIVDLETKQAVSRSSEPVNPAIEIRVIDLESKKQEKHYLFAKFPEFGENHGKGRDSLKFIYQYSPHGTMVENLIVLIGSSKEWVLVRDSKIVDQGKFQLKQPFKINNMSTGIQVNQLLPDAIISKHPRSRSEKMVHPAVDLEIFSPMDDYKVLLVSSKLEPVHLMNGEYALVFDKKQDDIKDYKSHLSIRKNGKQVATHILEVNHPLTYDGYSFYQSNYDPEDPTYSGIEVTRDPGLPFVYLGFILMVLGIIHVFYLKPRIPKRS